MSGRLYVGYTPSHATFEGGPIGKRICEFAVDVCMDHDYWGVVTCSNAAPHHPMWQDVEWRRT